jgi:hypothetical protein
MLFAEDSPAKTSVLQGRRLDWADRAAAYGASSPEWLAKYGRDTSSWRTCQHCLVEGLAEYSETWPRSGMTRNGTAYQLQPLVPLTSGIASGLWPTPDASVMQDGEKPETWLARRERIKAQKKNGNGMGMPLAMAVQLWPTPTTVSGNNAGRLGEWGGARSRRMISHLPKAERSGRLSPHFPEWLMGYPIDYTDCGPSETPSSRRSSK